MSSDPTCSVCGMKAVKQCNCGKPFCNRHFEMHSHPKGKGAGIG